MIDKQILKLREELNNSIINGEDYETIYKISVELDELIAEYYKKEFENLLEELLVSGYGLIYVKGYSMVPFLANEKDRVQLRRFDSSTEELKKGQVALFKFRGRYILHRVVGTIDKGGKKLYKFRGDGNCSGVEWAAPENVYAVMVKRITPSGEEWSCDSLSWKLRSALWPRTYIVRRVLLAVIRRLPCRYQAIPQRRRKDSVTQE